MSSTIAPVPNSIAASIAAPLAESIAASPVAALPGSLNGNRRLQQWLRFCPDGSVEIYSGKVEIGQGILTALGQIAAEELDLQLGRIRMIAAGTAFSPNEAVTSGSLSIQESGAALRHACADARAIYLNAAEKQLGVAADTLHIADGEIVAADGRSTSYWALADTALLDCEASHEVAAKAPSAYRLVGTAAGRFDLPGKIFGQPRYIHDLELPGMLHGRILRPPSPAATLISFDAEAAQAGDGVIAILRDGSLLGVLADSKRHADKAVELLAKAAVWHETESLPDEFQLTAWLKAQALDTTIVASKNTDPENASPVARTIKAAYAKPFLAHGSIAPSCALAQFDGAHLQVWSHSQGIFNLRKDLAMAFGMAQSAIAIQHVESAGCYGHNGADDVAFDAAWLARAALAEGRPVRVQWVRADELAWAPFGPAMAVELEADLDAAGEVIAWRHTIWSNGHGTRPGRAATPALLGSWHLAQAFERPIAVNAALTAGGGSERNAVPLYDFPAWHIVNHRVLAMPLRASALRALGAYANVFALESFVDELAKETAADPIEFRLRHLKDSRARDVIERAVATSGWRDWRPREGFGHGIGFAKYKNTGAYCAVVAEIEAGAEIRVLRLTIAVDVGLAVNPDGVANQIEGGAIQATSWTLKEAVRFDRRSITSDSWETYPILRFTEIPAVTVDVMPSENASVGAGEASLGPTAAAIGNAVCDALGVRVRELPLTAERIVAAFD
ncbi:MAG TPA: molybdopterin cofactor-binding domain-containing protein [Herbaspirillum sp.]